MTHPPETRTAQRASTDWFRDARYGLMCHYLDTPASSTEKSTTTSEQWNRRIDDFDVTAFAQQVELTGAGYVLFTIGQNSGHYCSPNSAYDALVGRTPSLCSRRDLIADIADALSPRGIRLLAYLPSGAPDCDELAMEKLRWQKGEHRNAQFQTYWETIIREWSERWGKRVSGWWIDGVYWPDAMYRHTEAPHFPSFAAALKSGNPDGLIAFNPGVLNPIISVTEHEDYTAGEIDDSFPVSCKPRPMNRNVDGAQMHVLSYLANWWGEDGVPRFTNAFVVGYTSEVNAHEGVITWDLPISAKGHLSPRFVEQLALLKQLQP